MKEKYVFRLERKTVGVTDANWIHVQAYSSKRPYTNKAHVKQLMNNNGGRDSQYDPGHRVYVSPDGRFIFRIMRAEIGEWEPVE